MTTALKIFLLQFIFIVTAKADYSHLLIHQALDKGEIIVEGEICEVNDSTISIDIKRNIKNPLSRNSIQIARFIDWPCAKRWTKYEIGQRAIFCLWKRGDRFQTVGFGNEGEMPIIANKVYYLTFLSRKNYPSIFNNQAFEFTYEEVIQGINNYLNILNEFKAKIADKSILNYKSDNYFISAIVHSLLISNKKHLGITNDEIHNYLQTVTNGKM